MISENNTMSLCKVITEQEKLHFLNISIIIVKDITTHIDKDIRVSLILDIIHSLQFLDR